ncbi:hypothetical protein B0H13DRAFT_2383933 [Mycena leptocephala]|nr:hypothetical protein B0H13DRAFT_2383933 [Mycena leptocephala]
MDTPPTNVIAPMDWHLMSFTKNLIRAEETEGSKSVQAVLIADGSAISQWIWVRVPLHRGIRRARNVDEVDVDIWLDAGRGAGEASSDLTGRSFQIDRYPLDEPSDLEHSFTIVVAPQHTSGANVHPVNRQIGRLVPQLVTPWRGNVLVFRHGKTTSKVMINVEEKDWGAIKMILTTCALPSPWGDMLTDVIMLITTHPEVLI